MPEPERLARRAAGHRSAQRLLIVGMLLPPVGAHARQDALVEALQYMVLAVAAPALLVLGSPWRLAGLSRRPGANSGRSPGFVYDLTRPP